MIIRTTIVSALMFVFGGLATSASAAVDQQNNSSTIVDQTTIAVRNIGTATPTVSQSFKDQSGAINFATFSLYATNTRIAVPTDTATYRVDLLAGNGLDGNVVASSAPQNLTFQLDPTNLQALSVTFNFSGEIVLTKNVAYTLELVDVSSTAPFKLGVLVSTGDQYAGGTWFNGTDATKYNNTNGNDLIFSEGYTPLALAVPEPANAALLMAGLGFMGLVARRRKAAE